MKTPTNALLIAFVCSTELTVEEDTQLTFNPDGLLKCLLEAAYAKEVAEIINMIRNRDYGGALNKALALINSGSQLIKRCIQYIVGASVNLTMDWLGAAKCSLCSQKQQDWEDH